VEKQRAFEQERKSISPACEAGGAALNRWPKFRTKSEQLVDRSDDALAAARHLGPVRWAAWLRQSEKLATD